jgi:hypothetical protein
MNIIEKEGMEDYFLLKSDDTMTADAHTGYSIDFYRLRLSFSHGIIKVRTVLPLCLTRENFPTVKGLFDSLNEIQGRECFVLEERGGYFCHDVSISQLEAEPNVFDAIFYGIEKLHLYESQILKAFTGTTVFMMQI